MTKIKLTLISILLVIIFSCTNENSTKKAAIKKSIIEKVDSKQKLVGEWKEYWGIGMETNVNYSDLFKIRLTTNGELFITCTNRNNYLVDQILFDGKELSFRKENTYDPENKFFVYYKMKLSEDANWLEGPIKNNKNEDNYVKWQKIIVIE